MATFSRIKIWVSNEVLTAADLNAEFDNIINNMTPSGVEDASANVAAMQVTTNPGGVGTESLATSLLGEIQRLRYVSARFVDSALGSEWYEAAGRSFAAGDLNVETADIEDGAVTAAKLAAVNQIVSADSDTFSTASTSYTDVTNLSVSITSTGRPIRLDVVSGAGPTEEADFGLTSTSGTLTFPTFRIRYLRDATTIATYRFGGANISTSNAVFATPPSFIEAPEAGTYVYKVQVSNASVNQSIFVNYCKLVATEL